ncbi:pantoate--beta-alanine ligase [Metasolibacillus sp.]|uniref:pantoate--beta-alanine ligase n=1 Tax=Metasolibacillus sp. TaxID=2703680 RepID=UPI0025D260D7|nr:pantoate--beta-alanine ligase [Metasolibacillus sp.]MCT6923182.1 pantoate--beta-alanine ligase [Metasolibacillus sp.]MCT6939513.1 pantoate--beta-alanine ligase [Metasolibacillus sp.]
MKVVTTIAELKQFVQQTKKEQKTIGLVPTMGYLHDGHLTLARTAKADNDVVIMSIFVNPTQFGPNEDFESYPRDLPRDTELAQSAGVDVIFAPSVEEMYPADGGIKLLAGRQATILCGASRPGHFDGVVQVVAKLFHLAEPTRAYFGQKDAQQVAIIETLVRDFNFPLEIKTIAIVREEDGLAKSSRNVYLSEQERAEAPAIFAALNIAKAHFLQTQNAQEAIALADKHITTNTAGRIDYLQLLSYPDLAAITAQTNKFLLAVAVYIGKTRLIDNLIFQIEGE